ncbi:MAG: hypothetical protein H6834_10915 [Planctomycetes bacterium]|nr:hypothetical protein [Planctomycetota bacterium]MCB9891725.1 hypothetical protein [Planctomycetota bacterium]
MLRLLSKSCPLLFVAFLHAQGMPTIDQSYTPTTGNGLEVTNNQSVQQTFTVGLRGVLTQIDLLQIRHYRGVSSQTLDFELRLTQSSVPDGPVLFATSFQPGQIGTSAATLSVDLSGVPVCVQPGDVLAISLSSASVSGTQTYAWGGDAPGGYANGTCYIRGNVGPLSYDMGFTTWVDVQPGLTLCLDQSAGQGSLRVRAIDGPPALLYATTFSFDTTNGGPMAGQGPWGGLFVTSTEIVTQLNIGSPPFLGTLDAQGDLEATFPAGTIHPGFAGTTMWAVTRTFDLGTGAFGPDSNVAALTLR